MLEVSVERVGRDTTFGKIIQVVDTIILDETGTLTMGIPEVTGIRVADGATKNEVLQNAAIAEQHSEHPAGEAIVRKARMAKLPLRKYADLRYFPGKGLRCLDGASKIVVGTRTLLEENGICIFDDIITLFQVTYALRRS